MSGELAALLLQVLHLENVRLELQLEDDADEIVAMLRHAHAHALQRHVRHAHHRAARHLVLQEHVAVQAVVLLAVPLQPAPQADY